MIIKELRKSFILIYTAFFIFIIFLNIYVMKIKAEDINDKYIQKEIYIDKLQENNLINNVYHNVYKERIFNGYTNNYGGGSKFLMINEGGYIIVTVKIVNQKPMETPLPLRSYKVGLYKIDRRGKVEWNRLFEFEDMNSNICNDIIKLKDGGYIILVDAIRSPLSEKKHYIGIIRIDNKGSLKWYKIFGNKNNKRESIEGKKILEIEDGYIVLGSIKRWGNIASRGSYIFKVDKKGNKLWERKNNLGEEEHIDIINGYVNNSNLVLLTDGNNNEIIYCVLDLKDGQLREKYIYKIAKNFGRYWLYSGNIVYNPSDGKMIIGEIANNNISDLFVLKLKDSKYYEWLKTFSSGNNGVSYKGIVGDKEGNFIVYGNIRYRLKGYCNDIFIINFNENGKINYMQIFSIGDKENEVKRMGINDKGELIGLFEWSTIENGKYNSYISIEKITVK